MRGNFSKCKIVFVLIAATCVQVLLQLSQSALSGIALFSPSHSLLIPSLEVPSKIWQKSDKNLNSILAGFCEKVFVVLLLLVLTALSCAFFL